MLFRLLAGHVCGLGTVKHLRQSRLDIKSTLNLEEQTGRRRAQSYLVALGCEGDDDGEKPETLGPKERVQKLVRLASRGVSYKHGGVQL